MTSTTKWEKEFDKELTFSHPGDSGPGGNVPQEPVYELSCRPEDVIAFIKDLLKDQQAKDIEKLEGMSTKRSRSSHGEVDGWHRAKNQAISILKGEE